MFEGVQDDQFRQFLVASAPIRRSGAIGRNGTTHPSTASAASATSINHHSHNPLSFSLFDGSSDSSPQPPHGVHHLPNHHNHHHHPNIDSPVPTSNSMENPIFRLNFPPPQPRVLPPPVPLLLPISHTQHHLNSGSSSSIQQPFLMHLQFPSSSDSQISKGVFGGSGGVKQRDDEDDKVIVEVSSTSIGFLSTSLGLHKERSSSSSSSSSVILPAASDPSMMSPPWSNEEVVALFRIRSAAAAAENNGWFAEFTDWEQVSRKLAEIGFDRRPAQICREKFQEESAKYFSTTPTAAINTSPIADVAAGHRISDDGNHDNVSPVKNNYRVFCDLEDLYDHGHHGDDDDDDRSYLHHQKEEPQVSALPPHTDLANGNIQTVKIIVEKQTQQRAPNGGHAFQMGVGQKGKTSAEVQAAVKGKAKVEEYTAAGSEETHMEDPGQPYELEDEDEVDICQGKGKGKKKRRRERRNGESITTSRTNSYYEEKFEIFKSFCEEMVRKMISHQEELHDRILRDMTKQEAEKIAREEAWKKQEMERFEREMECRAKEQAAVVERQAKIIEFLKKFANSNSEKNSTSFDQKQMVNNLPGRSSTVGAGNQNPSSKSSYDMTTTASCDDDESHSQTSNSLNAMDPVINVKEDRRPRNPRVKKRARDNRSSLAINDENNVISSTTESYAANQQLDIAGKRWPREEVLALINVRCNIDLYCSGSNKGTGGDQNNKAVPLWERISRRMMEMGYKRSAKRCKEKWENINKYFRKTKDVKRKKTRSADSRTCPYFNELSNLYSTTTTTTQMMMIMMMHDGSAGENVNVADSVNVPAATEDDDDDDNEKDGD